MTTPKRRITKPAGPAPVDLGVIELNAVQLGMPEQFLATETTELEVDNLDASKLTTTVPEGVSATLAVGKATTNPRVPVGIYKLSDTAKTPKYGTEGSACFDLHADFSGIKSVRVYTPVNLETQRNVQRFREHDDSRGVVIDAGERALIPTNLIFDIPEDWKMLIYARSGTALKQAMLLANSVGVVDHDYVDPTFVIIFNQSKERLVIRQGDRIAQAELVPVIQASFNTLSEAPGQKTTRAGGFGSTGK